MHVPSSVAAAFEREVEIEIMIFILSAITLSAGTVLSCAYERFPTQKASIERCSGMMVLTGLLLIGGGLPLFR